MVRTRMPGGVGGKAREGLPIPISVAGFAFWRCLPEPLFNTPFSRIILSRDGELLGAKIATDDQWRFPNLEGVPNKFKTALINFEDKRFYKHPSVDPLALLRAFWFNISNGDIRSGASTISMQVIKLSRKNRDRTYLEKLKEMLLALRLEVRYSKEEILLLYASKAPLGGNIVGLEAAATYYYGRRAEELSWAESCMLAVLPNSPALIHPGKNRVKLQEKRNRLIADLNKAGELSDLEMQLAINEPLPDKPTLWPHATPHMLETLLADKQLTQHHIETTIDKKLQKSVTQIVNRHSKKLSLQGIHNAAALVIDNRNFEVLAYVGNSNNFSDQEHANDVDIIKRPRSTGSILKPLLFTAMIHDGLILPKTLISDIPTKYAGYAPQNFDRKYRGVVPARVALVKSLNIPSVRMLKQYGISKFYYLLKKMKMSTLYRQPDGYGLTLILGGAEGTLWDLTNLYANLAMIARGDKTNGNETYKKPILIKGDDTSTNSKSDLSQGAAWLTINALQEVTRPGVDAFWKKFSSSQKIAWKTGTSYGMRDGWAIGSNKAYTVGVWIDNATGEGVSGLTGVNTAAPVMFDIFNKLPKTDWFQQPFDKMKLVEVCKEDGFLSNGYCETEELWIPEESHFDQSSPYHQLVHMDKSETWRVNGQCESVNNMKHKNWFVLKPLQEFYYRKQAVEYRTLPPFRDDCRSTGNKNGPLDIVYPTLNTKLYIPVDLGAVKSQAIFEAVHRDDNATLFWHLDSDFIGTTTTFHQQAVNASRGKHLLTVVDNHGNLIERWFEVLGL